LPHLFIYGGGALVWIACIAAIALATRRRLADLGGSVLRAGPIRLPLGFAISALGTAVIVLAVPTDLTWHAVFGKDLLIWSPPHRARSIRRRRRSSASYSSSRSS